MMRRVLAGAALLALFSVPLAAQSRGASPGARPAQPPSGSPALARAETAYRDLDFARAVTEARRSLDQRLTGAEQARAWELLAFAYAAMDSVRLGTEAFKQLIFLRPDRELDPARISPKITSLFALALGQVLVVRHVDADTATFVAGSGVEGLPIRATVTRTARVRTRVVGPAGDVVVDSTTAEGTINLRWNGLMRDGRPAASGDYRIVVEAAAGRDSYSASMPLRIEAGAVDSAAHLASLPGYSMLPETEIPPRSWRPLGVALIATAATAGAIVALESSELGSSGRGQLVAIGAGTSLVGVLATLRRPAPVPAPANIRYNALVREQLARRNADIAAENERRRQQVQLRVVPIVDGEKK